MKPRTLIAYVAPLLLVGGIGAQGISGTFDLTGVHVQYYNVARDSSVASEDVGSTHDLVLSWPSAATPLFEFEVEHFESGDTVASPETPDYLTTPEGLVLAGIDLSLTLNSDGSFEIPTSTYPTTATENCSTFAQIPTIQDAGLYEWDGIDDLGGFGILESAIFDLFSKDPEELNHGWIQINRDQFGNIDDLSILWVAIDGTDSDIGIDDAGNLNRQLGVSTLPADTELVAFLKGLNPNLNVGTFPTAGENYAGDGEDYSANWMYLFDPAGIDGVVFNGDEPLQFTGYYFTYNVLSAVGLASGLFEALVATVGLAAAATAAVDTVLETFGLIESAGTGFDAIRAAVSAAAGDSVAAWIGAGMDAGDALIGALTLVGVGGAVTATLGGWTFPDDSDHDYNPTDGNGRLVFEMGNQCVPVIQTRVVTTYLYNPTVAVEEESDVLPKQFALYQNYPNPFNPVTTVSFDIPKDGHVSVTVWNLLGEKVRTLHSGYTHQGRYTVHFEGQDDAAAPLATGVYLYRLDAGSYSDTKKMLLIK